MSEDGSSAQQISLQRLSITREHQPIRAPLTSRTEFPIGTAVAPIFVFVGLFRSRVALEAENLVLRHQLNVLRRRYPGRITFCGIDRLVFAGFYALAPNVVDALKIIKPETVIRWHRAGFRAYWRWKSRPRAEIWPRPQITGQRRGLRKIHCGDTQKRCPVGG